MRDFLLTIFLLASSAVYGQKVSYTILGEIKDPGENKFVYLHFFNLPDSVPALQCIPIKNKQFEFKGEVDLNKRLSVNAAIFLGVSSSLNYQEIYKTERELGNLKLCRMIVVEDLVIQIKSAKEIARAFVQGSILNEEKDEITEVSENGKYDAFLRTHPDSPSSLTLLSALTYLSAPLRLDKEYYLEIFNSFSLRLRTAPEGRMLMERIEAIN